jgi:hypothetical protein
MAWTDSRIFREFMIGPMYQASGTGWTGVDSDTIKAALFNNTTTPDNDAAVGSTGYNTGVWVTGNEVTGSSEWVAAGRTLASKTITAPAADTVMFDAADLTGVATITITNAFGLFVYDDTITAGTVADQGISYNYFGGAQSVTAGTFSVIFHANGINRFTL